MTLEPAELPDLPAVRAAFADARAFQAAVGKWVWPVFSDESFAADLAARQLYRVRDGATLAGVFVVWDRDPGIWRERERGQHLYLHRIARAAAYPGCGLFAAVLAWARAECAARGRHGLRMDTWADAEHLIRFYERFGFVRVGTSRIERDPRLPPHYEGLELALLERPGR